MKINFVATAIIALSSAVAVNAVAPMAPSFAQVNAFDDSHESAVSTSLAEGQGASYVPTSAKTITDAACEQMQGGVVVRLNTPECQLVKKPSADTLIMGAVQ